MSANCFWAISKLETGRNLSGGLKEQTTNDQSQSGDISPPPNLEGEGHLVKMCFLDREFWTTGFFPQKDLANGGVDPSPGVVQFDGFLCRFHGIGEGLFGSFTSTEQYIH